MPAYSLEAEAQVDALREFYESKHRIEASRNLDADLSRAELRIEQTPEAGLPVPRPSPALAKHGRRWIKEGRYWVAYTLTMPPVIVGVFYETADLPNRA